MVDALARTSEGDLRKAITYLQTAAKLFTATPPSADGDVVMSSSSNEVTVTAIEEIAGVVPQSLIDKLFESCLPGKVGLYSRVSSVVEDIVAAGWSAGGIIMQV